MKKKPTKLEAKVASLEKKITALEKLCLVPTTAPGPPKEPETFEDCLVHFGEAWQGSSSMGEAFKVVEGNVMRGLRTGAAVPSEKRAKQLAAIAKMMTVADALGHGSKGDGCVIIVDSYGKVGWVNDSDPQIVSFKHMHDALKAIKILGEEVIKTAYGL